MEKLIVETTGDFMLLDVLGGQEIAEDGPTEVNKTHFVELALADGRLVEVGAEKAPEPELKPDNAPPTSGKQAASKKAS